MSVTAALVAQRRFILYKLVPLDNGATDKVPIDPATGRNTSAQDESAWMLPGVALAWAASYGEGYGVGIALRKPCGLLFIDIDGCIADDGTLSDIARKLVSDFAGCYIEYSPSGRGLHIFGSYADEPPTHSCKNIPLHVELYTSGRFMTTTGRTFQEGSPLYDATAQLWATAWAYFRPAPGTDASVDWTTEYDPACTVTGTDDERIAFLRRTKSMAARFSPAKITFEDLWAANADKLAMVWPAPLGAKSGLPYDASSADQAFANHLAYGFGNNCEAIERVMEREDCALRRQKWDDRPDYRHSTILKACAIPKRWKRVAPVLVAPPPPTTLTAPPPPSDVPSVPAPPAELPERYVGASHMLTLFEGFVYVNDMHRIVGPDGFIMDKAKFDAHPRFAKRTYLMDFASTKSDQSGWDAFVQSEVSPGKKVRGAMFEPREAAGTILEREGLDYINTWREVPIETVEGDVTPFLTHLATLFEDWRLLLNYMKFMVQRKGEKAMWWPFLQGMPGNGKSFISDTMEYCIGTTYTQRPTPKNIDSNFNSTLYGCLFLAIEDIKLEDDYGAFWETLKPMVTQKRLEIEYKGVDKLAREVCFNSIMNSNHKNGIRKEPDDRRIAPFFARQQWVGDLERDGLTEDYFNRLWAWAENGGWAHVAHYLATDPIDKGFSAKKCPITSCNAEHIRVSRSPAEQEILEAVRCGSIGFRGGWLNLMKVNHLLDSRRSRSSLDTRRAMVQGLGYVPHPGLPAGALPTALTDGSLPILYVTGDHTTFGLTDPATIKMLYEQAQR